jgi:DNA-binding protein H-NS
MTKSDLDSRTIEELWALHEEIAAILSSKMEAEKLKLQMRLEQIQGKASDQQPERRPYPKVYPKFRNPEAPHQTWSGRGKQPRWMRKLLAQGVSMKDLSI